MIMAAHPNILRGESSTVSVLAWNSRKKRRVVRSSLGAECAAFSTGPEHTHMFRVLYGELCGDLCDLAEYETFLQMTDALCVNDCKSLADALLAASSAASKTSEDKRLGIELSMIKQRLFRDETRSQWVERATMPAGVLESEKLKTVLELYDLETHQKKLGPDYHRLKTVVKRSIEQEIRNKNFGNRIGNVEKNAVVKNQGTKQRVQRILGDFWQWETNRQCVKGDNCSFRHDMK